MRTDECLTEITAQAGTRTLIEYHLITGNPPDELIVCSYFDHFMLDNGQDVA
jgi:hypothetical protein